MPILSLIRLMKLNQNYHKGRYHMQNLIARYLNKDDYVCND